MSIKVVIVGAGGLVGARMIDALVSMSHFGTGGSEALPLAKIVLFDMRDITADLTATQSADSRVRCVAGDLTERATLDSLFDPDGCTRVTVIQLAAVLSGYAESNFELGMKVCTSRQPAAARKAVLGARWPIRCLSADVRGV